MQYKNTFDTFGINSGDNKSEIIISMKAPPDSLVAIDRTDTF